MPCVTDVWSQLQQRIRTSGAQPLVTYLDPAIGERTELSATSLANAAAKIANALRGEYELEPGDRVALDLPVHWQRSAWCGGVWTAGCQVTDQQAEAALVVTTVDRAATVSTDVPTVVASLHPFGLPVTDDLPVGVNDATIVVRQQPDAYLFEPAIPTLHAMDIDGRELSQEAMLAAAAELGPVRGDRVLVTGSLPPLTAWLACLALPLATEGSVVLTPAQALPTPLLEQERVTAELTT